MVQYLLTYMEKPGNTTAFHEVNLHFALVLSLYRITLPLIVFEVPLLVQQDIEIRKKPKFIVDMDDIDEDDGECFDEDDELYDPVCAICDNGGEILWYAIYF